MFDALVGRYVRHLNRRLMRMSGAPDLAHLPAPDPNKRYLLYLHVPFCVVLCPFCSFHRVEFRAALAARYFTALREEIRRVTALGYRFTELYVGGGTPTVLPDELAETIAVVARSHALSAVSVETNPHDLDRINMQRLRDEGVTRLSVGVQSFDDTLLREMGRYETYGSGGSILEHLGKVRGIFDTLNIDMIFNFPHQDEATLQADLDTLTEVLEADQVSWYPLMTSKHTRRPMAKQMGEVDYGRERKLYERIAGHMQAAGYQRASAWCFSRQPGMFDEYIIEHEEYVGLGSGAFSYLGGTMYANTFSISKYQSLIDGGATSVTRRRELREPEQMRYFLLMRLFSGSLDLDEAEERFNGRFLRVMRRDLAGLRLIGAVLRRKRILQLTESGYYLWVVLMREFFAGVNNVREDMRHNIAHEEV